MAVALHEAGSRDQKSVRRLTAADVGLSRAEQVRIVLRTILAKGGVADMSDIYRAVEEHLRGALLSRQGQASLREVVNRHAVRAGYIYPHNPKSPGWRITPKGRRVVEPEAPSEAEAVLNTARTAIRPSGPPVDVELQDLTDEAIDHAITTNRLRIGIVETNTETRLARQRRGQQRLRALTLLNYSSTCAVCDVSDPALLVASHIVAWAELPEARGMLSNILCLCKFHDALFEQGYWSLCDDFGVVNKSQPTSRTVASILDNATHFQKPRAHPPEPLFLRWHRLRSGLEAASNSSITR